MLVLKFGNSMSRLIGRSDNKEEVDGEFVEKFDNCIFNFPYVSRKQAMLKFSNGRFQCDTAEWSKACHQ